MKIRQGRVVPCGRMDGRRDEEASSRFSQFCESAEKRIMKEQVCYWGADSCPVGQQVSHRITVCRCLSQRPRGLNRGSAATCLLGFSVSNPAGGMDVCVL